MPSFGSQLVLSLALLAPGAMSHLCVMDPMQRGAFDVSTPGSHDCYRKAGPCGGQDAGTTITKLNGGSTYNVRFQQNLNHYTTDDPGSLVVDYAATSDPTEDDFKDIDGAEAITDYNAMNMITQTNFTMAITVPDADIEAGVLRVRYVSNNPGENDNGETFYQCSDISITSSATSGIAPTKTAPVVAPKKLNKYNKDKPFFIPQKKVEGDDQGDDSQGDDGEDHSCCAPSAFSITYQTIPSGGGEIFYDAKNQLMRVDYTEPGTDYSMFLNFTSGIEWLFNPMDASCTEYGIDPWVEWCYGKTGYSETYVGSGTCGDPVDEDCLGFANGDEWLFVATTDECYPAALNHTTNFDQNFHVYYGGSTDALDPDTFFAPCQESNIKRVGGPAPLDIAAVRATPAFHKSSHARRN